MKRLLLALIALFIAAAPVLADVCRAECERASQPACPLHQQTPHNCRHDHSVTKGTTAPAAAAAQPLFIAVAMTWPAAEPFVPAAFASTVPEHTPPLRSPHIVSLRI